MSQSVPAVRDPERCPSHPGMLIADLVETLPIGVTELADRLGISRVQVHRIIRGQRPVSPSTAARLGRVFGDGAGVWLRMQAAHDAWHAERSTDLSTVQPLEGV